MYVERSLEKHFDKVAEIYNIVAVVGARQSGKTTLLKKKLEGKNGGYVSLDDPDARELFDKDVKKFEKQYIEAENITGIDEVQYGKEAGIKLKYLADRGHRIWVTSSSETLLSKDVLSYLVGRVSILRLYPLSLPEFQKAKKTESLTQKIKERLVWEHASYGGYPKAVLADDFESKKIILKDLTDTMLLKDVSRTFAIEDISLLERLAKYLAVNTGNIVSYENITTYLSVSFQTLKKYLDAMEKSYIITRIQPYHTNKLKELSKKPKVYFIDTGLRNNIAKSYATEVEGKVFENYVLTELLKRGLQVKYWRTKSKAEVDFIVEKENSLIPVEAKTRAHKIEGGMKSFIKTYKPEKAFVVHYNGEEKEESFDGCKIKFTDVHGLLKETT
jgi:predicted AAA+ superfamily ATPase